MGRDKSKLSFGNHKINQKKIKKINKWSSQTNKIFTAETKRKRVK